MSVFLRRVLYPGFHFSYFFPFRCYMTLVWRRRLGRPFATDAGAQSSCTSIPCFCCCSSTMVNHYCTNRLLASMSVFYYINAPFNISSCFTTNPLAAILSCLSSGNIWVPAAVIIDLHWVVKYSISVYVSVSMNHQELTSRHLFRRLCWFFYYKNAITRNLPFGRTTDGLTGWSDQPAIALSDRGNLT